jgi:hypothetical protein
MVAVADQEYLDHLRAAQRSGCLVLRHNRTNGSGSTVYKMG